MLKICSCGKEYLYPRDFWQHANCAPKVAERANGETPLDQPAIPVASGTSGAGVDRSERRSVNYCPVCEARKAKDRERVKKWRAKKS